MLQGIILGAAQSSATSVSRDNKVLHQLSAKKMTNQETPQEMTARGTITQLVQMGAIQKADVDDVFQQRNLLLEENRKLVSKIEEITGTNQFQTDC